MRFLALFGLIALAEMATFFWVESRIGLLWALLIAASTALVGSVLVRRVGLAVLGRFRTKASHGTLPGRELSDGASVLVAGAFLISPGFLTDALGFLLLVPQVRGLIHRRVSQWLTTRVTVMSAGRSPTWQRPTTTEEVIDVEFEDTD